MTKANESFSAFLDDEATELDIQRMLKAMEQDPTVVNHWHDLSKTQAALQDMPVLDQAATLTRTAALSAPGARKSRWRNRFLQTGIAAAVAVVTVSSGHFLLAGGEQAAPQVTTIAVVSHPVAQKQLLTQQQYEAQQQLHAFLREHAEQAAFTTGHVVTNSPLQWVETE